MEDLTVLRPFTLEGKDFSPGDRLQVNAETAGPLLADGVVQSTNWLPAKLNVRRPFVSRWRDEVEMGTR